MKMQDPDTFTIPCTIGNSEIGKDCVILELALILCSYLLSKD